MIWLVWPGMAHIDTFDEKPKLAELHGQPMRVDAKVSSITSRAEAHLLRPTQHVSKWGQSGQSMAIWPHLGSVRRRFVHRPFAVHRAIPAMVAHIHEYGTWCRTSRHGFLVAVWIGDRIDGLPGFVMVSTGRWSKQPIAARQWHWDFCRAISRRIPGTGVGALRGIPKGDQRSTARCRRCGS